MALGIGLCGLGLGHRVLDVLGFWVSGFGCWVLNVYGSRSLGSGSSSKPLNPTILPINIVSPTKYSKPPI